MGELKIEYLLNFSIILAITKSVSSGLEEQEQVAQPANTLLNLIQVVMSLVIIVDITLPHI